MVALASSDGAATTLAEPKAERAKESATCACQIEPRGKVKHLPFALYGDTHAFIRNAQGDDAFPTAEDRRDILQLPARGFMSAEAGSRLVARNFRTVIEEESTCLHRIQGKPFAR